MRGMRLIIMGAVAATLSPASVASVDRGRASAQCLDVRADRQITLSGRLSRQIFAGPPNYESIAKGDAREVAFILELPKSICANDGGEFLSPGERFDRVHVFAGAGVEKALGAALGKRVTIRGSAFGAHTGHHRAPLVLEAASVTLN